VQTVRGQNYYFYFNFSEGCVCRVDVKMPTAVVVFRTIDSSAKCGVCVLLFDSAWGWCAVSFFIGGFNVERRVCGSNSCGGPSFGS
jgi:hypothetical protein